MANIIFHERFFEVEGHEQAPDIAELLSQGHQMIPFAMGESKNVMFKIQGSKDLQVEAGLGEIIGRREIEPKSIVKALEKKKKKQGAFQMQASDTYVILVVDGSYSISYRENPKKGFEVVSSKHRDKQEVLTRIKAHYKNLKDLREAVSAQLASTEPAPAPKISANPSQPQRKSYPWFHPFHILLISLLVSVCFAAFSFGVIGFPLTLLLAKLNVSLPFVLFDFFWPCVFGALPGAAIGAGLMIKVFCLNTDKPHVLNVSTPQPGQDLAAKKDNDKKEESGEDVAPQVAIPGDTARNDLVHEVPSQTIGK